MDPAWLFEHFGAAFLAVAAVIIFTECAIFPVLPGDSLLFAAGMFVAQRDGIRLFGLDETGTLLLALLILLVIAWRLHLLRDEARPGARPGTGEGSP